MWIIAYLNKILKKLPKSYYLKLNKVSAYIKFLKYFLTQKL